MKRGNSNTRPSVGTGGVWFKMLLLLIVTLIVRRILKIMLNTEQHVNIYREVKNEWTPNYIRLKFKCVVRKPYT
jgi:hypothetical protein